MLFPIIVDVGSPKNGGIPIVGSFQKYFHANTDIAKVMQRPVFDSNRFLIASTDMRSTHLMLEQIPSVGYRCDVVCHRLNHAFVFDQVMAELLKLLQAIIRVTADAVLEVLRGKQKGFVSE